MGKPEQKGKPTKPNDSNPEHKYFYNQKKGRWFWVTDDEPRKKNWVQADKEKAQEGGRVVSEREKEHWTGAAEGALELKRKLDLRDEKKKADEKAKETSVKKTTNKKKVTGGKVYKKPSATEKPPPINRSKKGGERTTAAAKADTGGHAGRTKTEKVTPTTDKTAVPTKDRSTKLRERTTATKTDTGGLGGRTKTEKDVEPETTTEAPQKRVTGKSLRPWLANKTTAKPKVEVEKPKVEVEKPKVEKPKAADTKPGSKIPKKDATAEFRAKDKELSMEEKLPKSGTKVEKAKESEDVKKKSGGKEGYFSRIKKVLSKKGKGVNARETYRRQRKRGGSTKDLLTKDRNKKFTMTGSRGKGLDVDSPNKTYDSRYKVKKGGNTSPNNKSPKNDAHVQSYKKHRANTEFRARGGKELSMEEKQPLNKKAAEKYGTIHKPAKVEKPAVGNNIKKVKSTWNTTSMTDSQLNTRNKRTFNVLKSRGR